MKRIRQFMLFIVQVITLYLAAFSDYSSSIKIISLLVYLMTLFSISYVLMLENRSPYKTLLWIYSLFFFPIVGYIFFIYSGQLEVKGHLFRSKREQATELIGNQFSFKPSSQWNTLPETEQSLSRLVEKFSKNQISFHTSSKVLKNGNETYSAIIEAIKQAEHYVHLEYYTFRSDQIGQEIIDLLCSKAKDGVEIRFIYDAFGSSSLSMKALNQMKEACIEAHCFLPVKYGFFNQKINFRNHRKIIIVDGEVGFVGGLNIGEEYLGQNTRIGFWRDTHLILKGEAIKSLQKTFVLDWAFVSGETLLEQKYFLTNLVEDNRGGIQIISSGPDSSTQGLIGELYYAILTSAKKSILIATPYFVPNKAIRTALSMAALKGINVKVLVPEINDGFLTQYATRSYFSEMLYHGIEVYMYQKGFLHQKVIIIDEEFASVGTANLDIRSLHLNFEVNAFLFETESVKDLVDHYKEDMLDSIKLDRATYKERGLILKTKESFARLFSPIL
ncbi:cardiolipin synthase [Bacillus solitudinis]|uniref:cardiolipin synthase n=1 Tax=Bacillus solitudinis TaxID=2014074 RepID=UPI0018E1E9D6|nr:cardiolipin synthase [Bacillus solitudinis]